MSYSRFPCPPRTPLRSPFDQTLSVRLFNTPYDQMTSDRLDVHPVRLVILFSRFPDSVLLSLVTDSPPTQTLLSQSFSPTPATPFFHHHLSRIYIFKRTPRFFFALYHSRSLSITRSLVLSLARAHIHINWSKDLRYSLINISFLLFFFFLLSYCSLLFLFVVSFDRIVRSAYNSRYVYHYYFRCFFLFIIKS